MKFKKQWSAFVSPQRAAQMLRVSESTIMRRIWSGRLPAIRMGRLWRILLTDLRWGSK
jgi:excisionase family DNA binding protein